MRDYHHYIASDYAGLETTAGRFYYGYEVSKCLGCGAIAGADCCENEEHEWCFEAVVDGEKTIIPHSELGGVDEFEVAECLLAGIAKFLVGKEIVDVPPWDVDE